MIRVIIHIGPPKTGSTAIQSFLFEQRSELRKLGILYPRSGLKNKDAFGPRHKRLTHHGPRKAEYWSRLIEEIKDSKCKIAIISCEAFWRYEQHIPEIAARLGGFDVLAIAVLRRQDRLLSSRYAHFVRHDNYALPPEALWTQLRHLMDFHARLRLWAAWVPTKAMLYPEHRHGLIEQFLRTIEAGQPVIDLAARLRHLYAGRNASPVMTDPDSVLGAALANAVRSESYGSNRALFAEYFAVQEYTDALWT